LPEKQYTGQEAAALLGVSYETVLKLAQERVLRSVRIGRLRRFPASAIDEFIARNTDVVVDLTSRLHPPNEERS
jgi:excisionase family DNA binding protein